MKAQAKSVLMESISVEQITVPRVAVLWLLSTQLLALGLHISHMPIWLWGMAAFVVSWRWLTHIGVVSFPNKWVKAVAVLLACTAVVVAFNKTLSLESASAFLIAAALLKLLEMKNRRDAYIVVYMGVTLLAIGFLFDQSLLTAAYAVIVAWLLISSHVLLHQASRGYSNVDLDQQTRLANRRALNLAAVMLLSALPLMLVLYLLFPRFAPLWSFTLQSSATKTGLSEQMTSADIQELTQSDELVFRASFMRDIPARDQLYWRALVMDYYDGRTWRSLHKPEVNWYREGLTTLPANAIQYDIIQEASGEHWLYALRGVIAQEQRMGVTEDDRLIYRRPVYQRIRYLAASSTEQQMGALTEQQRQRYTQLPDGYNPRTQRFVKNLQIQSNSDAELLDKLMQQFKHEAFYYTLKPSRHGEHEIDEFLFETQRGFCAHYAGAMVFMARSAGIPARLVTGYQGGELNAAEGYLTIRQYDAHAWVEVWLNGQWIQYDPTAMVAEDRILYGLERAVREEGTFLQDQGFSPLRMSNIGWINTLRLQVDTLNYYWQRWVLSYDREQQQGLFSKLFGFREYQQALIYIAYSVALFFVMAALMLWWQSRPKPLSPLLKAWTQLQEQGLRHGVDIRIGETPANYCLRLAERCPQQQQALLDLAEQFNRVVFMVGDSRTQQQRERALIKEIQRVRRQLPRGHSQKQPLPATLTKGP